MTRRKTQTTAPAPTAPPKADSEAALQLPPDAIAEGFWIPDEHNGAEARDFCRRFWKASPGPYDCFWRIYRMGDGRDEIVDRVDVRKWDEGEYAEHHDAGEYRCRCIIARGGRGVNAVRTFTVAKAFSQPLPSPMPPKVSTPVEHAIELRFLRQQHSELLEAVRSLPPVARGDWIAVVPACLTAVAGVLKLVMDNGPSTTDLLAIMDKRTGMGELSDAIATMRDLAADQFQTPEDGSIVRELLAAMPLVLAELQAHRRAIRKV